MQRIKLFNIIVEEISCGNCKTQYKRTVSISNIITSDGSAIAGVNSNYGDVATITKSSLTLSNVDSICDTYEVSLKGFLILL
ncbi:Pectate lyase [Abortiporus biennis]